MDNGIYIAKMKKKKTYAFSAAIIPPYSCTVSNLFLMPFPTLSPGFSHKNASSLPPALLAQPQAVLPLPAGCGLL